MNVTCFSSPLKALLVGSLLLGASLAQAAYGIFDYQGKGIDPSKRTHIIVAGKGSDMGLQFHASAAAQARKIQDVNPNDQVVLIAVLDDGQKSWLDSSKINELRRMEMTLITVANLVNENNPDDVRRWPQFKRYSGTVVDGTKAGLAQWGFGLVAETQEDLGGEELVGVMSQFNQIASFNVYSHSTAYYGLILDGPMKRLDPTDANLASALRSRFTRDAYAWLHGCNSGILGMKFTTAWAIPVATSFTSTGFQELFKKPDGTFEYVHDYSDPNKGLKNIPTGYKRVGVNSVSYAKTQSCTKVPCVRMMPDNHGYVGHWGNFFDGGVGFYRFTCSPSRVEDSRCKAVMAIALVNQVNNVYADYNATLETFKTAAKSHLCPTGSWKVKPGYTVESCYQALERSLTDRNVVLDTFMSKSLQCDRRTCNARVDCLAVDNAIVNMFAGSSGLLVEKSCRITNKRDMSRPITTQVQEFRDLVEGFKLMKQMKGLPLN